MPAHGWRNRERKEVGLMEERRGGKFERVGEWEKKRPKEKKKGKE